MQATIRTQAGLALALALGLWVPAQGAEHAQGAMAAKPARPALAVGAAFAPDGTLWVAGLDDQGRMTTRSSSDLGAHWNAPQVLDTAGEVIAAEGEARPVLAFGPGGAAVITYTMPLAKPYTGEIHLLRSADGGRHFAPPVVVHDDRQVITHRFANAAFDSTGRLYVAWVDKRDSERARAAAGNARDAYDGAAIYAKVSADGGAHFGPDLALAGHSCECCRIALVDTPDQGMVAMWRHVFPGNVRDHAFAPLSALGKGAQPVRATEDGWVIAACPHHGPGLARRAAGGFHAVWYGLRNGHAAARYGWLDANGHPASVPRELPEATAEHADVVAHGPHVAVVWRSFDGKLTHLTAWESSDDGAHFRLRELGSTPLDNDHPRLAQSGATMVVVWRTTESLEVHRVAQ